ncbi:MAG: PQQ-binding-like beta-propeller repeat protein [Planctomycetota bacterium]
MPPLQTTAVLFLACCLLSPAFLCADEKTDWPQLHGPRRDGIYRGPPLTDTLPAGRAKPLWKKNVGQGFAGPAVAGGRLVLFHRVDNMELLDCMDAATGKAIWSSKYPATYRDRFGFDEGPRAVPTIEGGRIYTNGAAGTLSCTDLESGKKIWRIDTHAAFKSPESFFGTASAPLVYGDKVFVQVGGTKKIGSTGKGSGIVAFESSTGKALWGATSDEAGYSSPVIGELAGKLRLVCFTRTGIVILDPTTGAILFEKRWRARIGASVNAASPVLNGDRIYFSSSYQTGSICLEAGAGGYRELWSGDNILSSHYSSIIEQGGFLYGFDGRQEYGTRLRCVSLTTGKIAWNEAMPGKNSFGSGTLILAADKLLVLTDSGELIICRVSSTAYRRLGSTAVLTGTVRAYPALAGGLLYARSTNELACIDLGKTPAPRPGPK